MNDYLLTLLFAYCPLLAAAILVWWLMLRWLDWLAGLKFARDVAPVIRKTSIGAGLYFGARLVAVALVVAAVFGAVRF